MGKLCEVISRAPPGMLRVDGNFGCSNVAEVGPFCAAHALARAQALLGMVVYPPPKQKPMPPPALTHPDFDSLKVNVIEGVRLLYTEGRAKDFEQHVFEAALEAVYGQAIWDWWKLEDRNTD